YGIFNGSRFRTLIAPRIARFVRKYDPRGHGTPEFTDMDFDAAAARANGHMHEVAAAAFTFAPANDSAPDRTATRLRVQSFTRPEAADARSAARGQGPYTPPFRLFALAGNLIIDGFFRLPLPLGFSAAQNLTVQDSGKVRSRAEA
ncbi:MAG TPA: hypothetical protein VE665_05900, partial [Hyphomicrobiaceae bacterium]|nr:hypothetical protein [Hyphomicrobiaceae bacterium]